MYMYLKSQLFLSQIVLSSIVACHYFGYNIISKKMSNITSRVSFIQQMFNDSSGETKVNAMTEPKKDKWAHNDP